MKNIVNVEFERNLKEEKLTKNQYILEKVLKVIILCIQIGELLCKIRKMYEEKNEDYKRQVAKNNENDDDDLPF